MSYIIRCITPCIIRYTIRCIIRDTIPYSTVRSTDQNVIKLKTPGKPPGVFFSL